jgi:hypothetical protein
VLFFIAFLESLPGLTQRRIPLWLCNSLMGFALLWTAQFHLSWIVLPPLLAVSLLYQARAGGRNIAPALGFTLLGAVPPGIFLLPTLWKFGPGAGSGGMENAVALHYSNLLSFFTVLGQFLSFACSEVPRFIGAHTAERLQFLSRQWWAAPFVAVSLVLGIVHAVTLLFSALRRGHPRADWPAVRTATFMVFLLIYGSFLFSVKGPTSYSFYLALPLVMLYSFYVLYPWIHRRWFKIAAAALLVCNGIFHLSLAVDHFPDKSLFGYRDSIREAIEHKDYRLMGERRPHSLY